MSSSIRSLIIQRDGHLSKSTRIETRSLCLSLSREREVFLFVHAPILTLKNPTTHPHHPLLDSFTCADSCFSRSSFLPGHTSNMAILSTHEHIQLPATCSVSFFCPFIYLIGVSIYKCHIFDTQKYHDHFAQNVHIPRRVSPVSLLRYSSTAVFVDPVLYKTLDNVVINSVAIKHFKVGLRLNL